MSSTINGTLDRFAEARELARRFHAATIGDDIDPHKCFADWLIAIRSRNHKRLEAVYKSAMAETSGTIGGYTVPTEFSDKLFQTVEEDAIMRPRATVVPMGSAELYLGLPDLTTAQSANTAPYFGGILLNWKSEAADRGETAEGTWRQVKLHAWELSGYALTSRTLLADSPALEKYLYVLFGRAIAWYEDQAFLVGNGVGKPMGLLKSGAAISISRNTSGHFKLVDAAAMLAKLLPSSWARAIWVMHPSVFIDVYQLSAPSSGGAGYSANQPNEPRQLMPAGVLGPCPVFISDKLPALGTVGDVILTDPGLYVIGDRQIVDIAVSEESTTVFANNQAQWRLTHRIDGQPWISTSVTLADGTQTASSIVTLAT